MLFPDTPVRRARGFSGVSASRPAVAPLTAPPPAECSAAKGRSADMAQTATRPATGSRTATAAGSEGGPDAVAAPLSGLLAAVLATEAVRGVVATAGTPSHRITAPAGARPFLASALAADTAAGGAGRPVLLVTATGREAEVATAAVGDLLGDDKVMIFPSWETLPHERLSPRADTVGKRLAKIGRAHSELQSHV